jgi:hypothetical protein
MPVDGAAHAGMQNDASPRPTGIRGLALRTFETASTTRAPLFGVIPTGSVEWPVSDIDQLSSALDDAARRDGIDFGELDA